MRPITGSILGRVAACPASASLPAVFGEAGAAADRGTAIHRYLELAMRDPSAALASVPEEYRAECSRIDLDALRRHLGPDTTEEVTYCYAPADGSATLAGQHQARSYGDASRLYLTIDAEATGPLTVLDYKTGEKVADCRDNWQMRLAAVAVAAHRGADAVRMTVAYLDDGGRWELDTYQADAIDLDTWAAEIRAIHAKATAAAVLVENGRAPDVSPSASACRWCPCVQACPAHTALARQLPPTLADIQERIAAMTPAEAGAAWETLVKAERLCATIRGGLENVARVAPLELPDGRKVRAVETQRETIDGEIAARVLLERYGTEAVGKACRPSVSKTSLKAALNGGSAEALEAIREAGGIKTSTVVTVKETSK